VIAEAISKLPDFTHHMAKMDCYPPDPV
jgi:hypothetical protein